MENVERYYADNPALVAKFKEIADSGRCPFCHLAAHKKFKAVEKFVGMTMYFNIVHNEFPYKHADGQIVQLHLLVLPKRHIVRLDEMTAPEWADLAKVLRKVKELFPFIADGFGMAARSDKVGGVTLYHLHWHIIVPEIGEEGQKPVNFGIG